MRYLFLAILCLLLLSCGQDEPSESVQNKNITACGLEEPQKNLPWLVTIIEKAENDETGNYWGTIWLEKYNEQDIFVTNMMLGSGGLAYWFFDCSGNNIAPQGEDADFDLFMINMKLDIVVYSNMPV